MVVQLIHRWHHWYFFRTVLRSQTPQIYFILFLGPTDRFHVKTYSWTKGIKTNKNKSLKIQFTMTQIVIIRASLAHTSLDLAIHSFLGFHSIACCKMRHHWQTYKKKAFLSFVISLSLALWFYLRRDLLKFSFLCKKSPYACSVSYQCCKFATLVCLVCIRKCCD